MSRQTARRTGRAATRRPTSGKDSSRCHKIHQPRPPRADPVISLRDARLALSSAEGMVEILRGITLNIEAGETVGVLGPSGAGKTSLLMIMAGLESLSGGGIDLAGQDITGMGEDALAALRRDNVGIIFQAFRLIPSMTALQNVAVPLELAGRADATELAAAALESVGLGHRKTHLPDQMSGGEQQRVAIARAIAPRPRILLADEPTGNLDSGTSERVISPCSTPRRRPVPRLCLSRMTPRLPSSAGVF